MVSATTCTDTYTLGTLPAGGGGEPHTALGSGVCCRRHLMDMAMIVALPNVAAIPPPRRGELRLAQELVGRSAPFTSHYSLCVRCTSRLAEAGHKVVGVEISEKAVKDFFTENHLPFEQEQIGKLVRYKVSLTCCSLYCFECALSHSAPFLPSPLPPPLPPPPHFHPSHFLSSVY